jgi:hypothetical protein
VKHAALRRSPTTGWLWIFQWDDDGIRFVLDQHASLDFNSASSLKQSADGHVFPLGHISLIQSQPVVGLLLNAVVCSSSIYGFWLPLWYLQTLLKIWNVYVNSMKNSIGGVMVSVLASYLVDRVFEPRSCQTKDSELFPRFALHRVSEWVICIFMRTLQFCSENKLIFSEMMMGSALY